jgi:hypothetical protein
MDAPLTIPSPFALAMWRAVSGLPVLRRILRAPEEARVTARAVPDTDDDIDTSLTQAHLELLK